MTIPLSLDPFFHRLADVNSALINFCSYKSSDPMLLNRRQENLFQHNLPPAKCDSAPPHVPHINPPSSHLKGGQPRLSKMDSPSLFPNHFRSERISQKLPLAHFRKRLGS